MGDTNTPHKLTLQFRSDLADLPDLGGRLTLYPRCRISSLSWSPALSPPHSGWIGCLLRLRLRQKQANASEGTSNIHSLRRYRNSNSPHKHTLELRSYLVSRANFRITPELVRVQVQHLALTRGWGRSHGRNGRRHISSSVRSFEMITFINIIVHLHFSTRRTIRSQVMIPCLQSVYVVLNHPVK